MSKSRRDDLANPLAASGQDESMPIAGVYAPSTIEANAETGGLRKKMALLVAGILALAGCGPQVEVKSDDSGTDKSLTVPDSQEAEKMAYAMAFYHDLIQDGKKMKEIDGLKFQNGNPGDTLSVSDRPLEEEGAQLLDEEVLDTSENPNDQKNGWSTEARFPLANNFPDQVYITLTSSQGERINLNGFDSVQTRWSLPNGQEK